MRAIRHTAAWGLAAALVAVSLGAAPASAVGTRTGTDAGADPAGITHEQNPTVPAGAAWTETYFPSSAPSSNGDPVELHADVLRPANLAPDAKTPVIMSIGPYFSHSGMNEDTHPAHTGPSSRFTDLIDGAQLMARGYTFVYVDLRGFGASTGCIDWLGSGEQADVVTAIEWAARQPWSTGAVGLYGKSYDGSTGLVGVNRQPEGLRAVVAQEPSWSGRDYLVTNGVSRVQQVLSPLAYVGIASLPGVDRAYHQDGYDIPADTDHYLANAGYEKTHPECRQTVMTETREMDPQSAYWRLRHLPANVNGSTVPLMFTQGLTEQNTKPEGMQEYLSNHAGEQRAWLGPWDHVRGNDVDAQGRLEMGRSTWFAEVMDFYDAHLKDGTTAVSSSFFVQDNFGAWRHQDSWGTTGKTATIALAPGTYRDTGHGKPDVGDDDPNAPPPSPLLLGDEDPDAAGGGPDDAGTGIVTRSRPVRTDVRLTGTPIVDLQTQGAGNTQVELWDVAPDHSAVMINVNVARLSADGHTSLRLMGMDWTLRAGHALAVTVDTIDSGDWVPEPSEAEVRVASGSIAIALASPAADVPAEGARAPYLDRYLARFTSATPLPHVATTFALSTANGRIGTDAASVAAGGELVVAGSGYDPGAPVVLSVSDEVVATATADATGAFRATIRIPAGAAAGRAVLAAVAEDGGRATVELTVTARDARPAVLAHSGMSADGLPAAAVGAGLAVALGAALVVVRHRSRTFRR